MRRSAIGRYLAVVYALWLAVVLAEPAALHACAMHDGAHGAAHVHGATTMGRVPTVAHSSPERTKTPQCSCVGTCCATVAVAAPHASDVLSLFGPIRFERVLVSAASDYRPAANEYARPPTIGPPQLTV